MSGIGRSTERHRGVLVVCRQVLCLGVGGNGGCAEAGNCEGQDEQADDVALHVNLLENYGLNLGGSKNFSGQTRWLQHMV